MWSNNSNCVMIQYHMSWVLDRARNIKNLVGHTVFTMIYTDDSSLQLLHLVHIFVTAWICSGNLSIVFVLIIICSSCYTICIQNTWTTCRSKIACCWSKLSATTITTISMDFVSLLLLESCNFSSHTCIFCWSNSSEEYVSLSKIVWFCNN